MTNRTIPSLHSIGVLSVLAVLTLVLTACAAMSAIIVDTTAPSKPVSRFLYGSVLTLARQGSGTLDTNIGELKYPVTYNSFLIAKAREMQVTTFRFCGDNYYNFRDGIGPLAKRPASKINPFLTGMTSNDFGTDEFIALCKMLHVEPVMCAPYLNTRDVRADSKDGSQLSANWVEYCNGNSPGLAYGASQGWEPTTYTNSTTSLEDWSSVKTYTPGAIVRRHNGAYQCLLANSGWHEPGNAPDWTKYWKWLPPVETARAGKSWLSTDAAPKGYFAWLREYFGHPEPYAVKYWEVGNEPYAWESRYSWGKADAYRDNFVKFEALMRVVDPTIQIGLVIPGPRSPQSINYSSAHPQYMLTIMGAPGSPTTAYQKADFLVWHVYQGSYTPVQEPPAHSTYIFNQIALAEGAQQAFMQNYPKPVMITETNINVGIYKPRLWAALAYAKMLSQYARIGVFAAHQMYFSEVGAWFQSSGWRMIFDDEDKATGKHRQNVTPTYLAVKLYSLYGRGDIVKTTASDQANLDCLAIRSGFDGRLRLFVINQSPTDSEKANIDVSTFNPASLADVHTLNSPDGMDADNESTEKVTITDTQVSVGGGKFQYSFPAHSLTVLDFAPQTSSAPLSVNITPSTTSPRPGATVRYTITCTNTSSSTVASGEVGFDIPVGCTYVTNSATSPGVYSTTSQRVTWAITNLAAGGSMVFKCDVKVR